MAKLEVLISGAGIAGCTLAYWLTRNGHSVTVVERSGSLRSSGSPVDVRGPAVDVAEPKKGGVLVRKPPLVYLSQLDITAFDPKMPPPKTAAFWSIVDPNRALLITRGW
jgi:monoamine oxidase